MSAHPKRPRDANQLAKLIVGISTGEIEESAPTPKQLAGHKGGTVGGVKRKEALTAERRSEIAKKAAQTRWKKP